MTTQEPISPGPLELLESARAKYTLAQSRIRRGPPEFALLSLHGSLEDALRAHAMRRQLDAAVRPFPQLLEALTSDSLAPLSAREAENILRMHHLRARIAHGEQITLAGETFEAYQRFAANLLPRYGVLVVGPEDLPESPPGATAPRTVDRKRATPPRERTVYPEEREVRATLSARSATERMRRNESDRYDERVDRTTPRSRRYLDDVTARVETFGRMQSWLVPALIIVSIFLIGATLSIAWQQFEAGRAPAAPAAPTFNPVITTAEPPIETSALLQEPIIAPADNAPATDAPAALPSPTELPADAIAVGRIAFVRTDIPGLNVRAAPNNNAQILFALAPNTQMEVIGGPTEAGGFTWWEISSAGQEGWAAGEFIAVVR